MTISTTTTLTTTKKTTFSEGSGRGGFGRPSTDAGGNLFYGGDEMPKYELVQADCLEAMKEIAPGSVDLVLTDPPYGTTQCKWDSLIPFEPMWAAVRRVLKPRGAAVFTASQPFPSALVMSNVEMFAYEWVWVKSKITGVLNAKKMPVRKHEQVLVFCDTKTTKTYNAQGLVSKGTVTKQGGNSDNYGARSFEPYVQEWTNWPRDVIEIASEGKTVHPTQKPVALMEYLIRTYTRFGETVSDFTMGSGTTGVAAMNTGRNFIGIEREREYFEIAEKRIEGAAREAEEWESVLGYAKD
jgi:site-specific DNA-methyltransferase (adenine-specific)